MKRRVATLMMMILILMSLAGCGKSEEEKAVDSLQEFGLDEQEAQEIMDAIADEPETEEKQESSIELVEPKEEIVNSKFGDPIIQIENTIINLDGTETVEDVINKLSEDPCFDSVSIWGADYAMDTRTNPISNLGNNFYKFYLAYERDGKKGTICTLYAINCTENVQELKDCSVVLMESDLGEESLNIFYGGNICAGIFNPAFEDDLSAKERFKNIEISDEYVDQIIQETDVNGSLKEANYKYKNSLLTLNGEDVYLGVKVMGGTQSSYFITPSLHYGSEAFNYVFDVDKDLTDSEKQIIIEKVKSYLLNESGAISSQELTYVGYISSYMPEYELFAAVFIDESGNYIFQFTKAGLTYNGNLNEADISYPVPPYIYPSLEAMLEDFGATEDDAKYIHMNNQ